MTKVTPYDGGTMTFNGTLYLFCSLVDQKLSFVYCLHLRPRPDV
ncbi:MAG: hypothetical protein AAGF89_12680 [Bacteroidota bacterium]